MTKQKYSLLIIDHMTLKQTVYGACNSWLHAHCSHFVTQSFCACARMLNPCARRGILARLHPCRAQVLGAMEEAIENTSRPNAEVSSEANQDVGDHDTTTIGLRVDGEADKLTEIAHNEPNRSKTIDIDAGEVEEGTTFELGVEDSKDLLSLSEELNNILDPKVYHYHANHTRGGGGACMSCNFSLDCAYDCRTPFARHLLVLTSLLWNATPSR